jgi:hypothetical protein
LEHSNTVGQTIAFRGLLGLLEWAFRPRNFMKNLARHRGLPDVRGGFSTLSERYSRRDFNLAQRRRHGLAAGGARAAVTLSTSACSIYAATASVTALGTALILNLPVTFTAAYAGAKGIDMYVRGGVERQQGMADDGMCLPRRNPVSGDEPLYYYPFVSSRAATIL